MKRIFKDFIKAFLIGLIIFIILNILRYVNGLSVTINTTMLKFFFYNQFYSVALYLINASYFGFLLNQFPDSVFRVKNLVKGVLGGLLVTLLGLFVIRIIIEVVFEGNTFSVFLENEKIQYYYISFAISFLVTAIFYAVYYYKHNQETKVTQQKIIAGTASAKFDALKNQLDPHFLFNSLNVLASLIEENPDAATEFTTALSKVYRYVLEQKNKDLVFLEEELNFAKLYMRLMSLRFEDGIVFTYPSELKNPEAKIVPLSLQLLLENAVKHNQVDSNKKLYISIEETEDFLIVKNNIQTKTVLKESTGFGLKNIHQRYSLLTDRPVKIIEDSNEFNVSLPLLTQTLDIMNFQDDFISEKRYKSAKKQVEKLKAFYIHLGIYIIFIPILIYLNVLSLSETRVPWALFAILGWGFGIMGHASETFDYNPIFGKNWEERKIRNLMNKEK